MTTKTGRAWLGKSCDVCEPHDLFYYCMQIDCGNCTMAERALTIAGEVGVSLHGSTDLTNA